MVELYYPCHYASKEGGHIAPWISGPVAQSVLKGRDPRAIPINGVRVHSLYFEDGSRWDCINGWNATVKPLVVDQTLPSLQKRPVEEASFWRKLTRLFR